MKCEKCGAELFNSAKFCHVCGNPMPQKEKPVLTRRLECKHCGGFMDVDETRNVKICPYCGSKELVEESDQVTMQRIKSHAWKEVEQEKEETRRLAEKEITKRISEDQHIKEDKWYMIALFVLMIFVIVVFVFIIGPAK